MDFSMLHDPLSLDLHRQWSAITPYIDESLLQNDGSQEELVDALARMLHDSRYTILIAHKFRPILFLLCAKWLDQHGDEDAKFAALALLIQPHEELFPIFSAFIRNSHFCRGPLDDMSPTSTSEMHMRLLAYYRILVACPHAPTLFQWPHEPLFQTLSFPGVDNGIRWLIVRCYSLHTGMSEAQRDEFQESILGPFGEIDVAVEAGRSIDGNIQWLDGWLLPVLEMWRVREHRRTMLDEQGFYLEDDCQSVMRINLERLTSRVADIHGILLLKNPSISTRSALVSTPSTVETLRTLAIRLSLRLPILLSSPPSSGKSIILEHLAALIYPSQHQLVTLHLSDTSVDARSLLGSYVSSTKKPGSFEWQEGVIVRAMKHGLWLVLEDIDRASSEVLGTLIPLVESLAVHKHIGAPASLLIPGHGMIEAAESFAIFATRSIPTNDDRKLPPANFLGNKKFSCVDVPTPTEDELVTIINGKFLRLGRPRTRAIIHAWVDVRALGSVPGARGVGINELETWCKRIESLLPPVPDVEMEADEISLERLFPQVRIREEIYLEARDVFFGSGAFSESVRTYMHSVAHTLARHLGLSDDRAKWVLESRLPEFQIERDGDGYTTALRIGKTRLPAARRDAALHSTLQRPFAMHRPALLITERISSSVSFAEPVLLVGETGTGKTTLVSHIASLLHRKLISLNLSHQTESSDLLGGFKPVDPRAPASELQQQFLDLFAQTFSRRKNSKFEEAVRKAVSEGRWKRAVGLWKECTRLAKEKIKERAIEMRSHSPDDQDDVSDGLFNSVSPRKRRKLDTGSRYVDESQWLAFAQKVELFNVQHIQSQGRFAFGFVEGPLVQALKNGYWVLLDEINLASAETLECISSILQGPTASIVLTEQGSFLPVHRHPDFRLFACMNPATDVGKKDLPVNIRSRFTEIHMSPPDTDRETLLTIIHQYIGHCSLADKSASLDVTEFYLEVKRLAEERELADGSNRRPHFSMRTLARALVFTSDMVLSFGLRRALWEGCLMAFSMALNERSMALVTQLAKKYLLAGVKNVPAMMMQLPPVPSGGSPEDFERIGPFWLQRGRLPPVPASRYILTPSVQAKLIDLARVIVTRRFPVLIEGPTSSGKTSAIEYLARRTGHRFVRVNNHEHTDIQEYLGTYVSDADTGKLVFHDGILIRALRTGDWIVLDELNLAPTDVLEALNRLLDDNRELVIPETQEVIKPHPHFMLFATQNPPGLYAGRKVLSRAFRNRFLEIQFDDVPQSELRTILSERCRIPESYASRIVAVFQELSKRRQAGRVFESKHGFATLRDLFRWAGRKASSTLQLAQNGYMLLAERSRRPDDKEIVKEVIETVMKERIDTTALYDLQDGAAALMSLGIAVPVPSSVIWTSAMRRLFVLVANALKYDEPVLLVGDTGSGKTTVCQLYADAVHKDLITLNCHQSTETADLIGSQRPLRNRLSSQAELIRQALETLRGLPELTHVDGSQDVDGMLALLSGALKSPTLSPAAASSLRSHLLSLQHSKALFEWHDGPLIRAMRTGDTFLLDEISLADDSVLERLNSVLEPARTIVLAERGGFDVEHSQVTAHPDFRLIATMNPGGDYGKKELSPALRNRFTEIWVPHIELKSDLRMIIHSSWRHEGLLIYTDAILAFTSWFASAVGNVSVASLRDILAWVDFANEVLDSHSVLPTSLVFHHAAHMIFLDGLETSIFTSGWSKVAIRELREQAQVQLEQLAPLGHYRDQLFDNTVLLAPKHVFVGSFGIAKGNLDAFTSNFSLQAPTTLDNVRRLIRACQLSKPILLEGSPGVGKTSLVAALGDMTGHRVCRINLSDQTDLVDLFGSDFPVEGGLAGEFTWKDATFLQAMQNGDWVLLDEMNLAPQTVLEGLNAILDHRGTVFIPELGRSFSKHPRFRIFAAQNPLYQGGGRKGLPRSYLDRFSKVYIQPLTTEDLFGICQNVCPSLSHDYLRSMISFNNRLDEEVMTKHSFGRDGAPWEFNLRDIIRWATLLSSKSSLSSPSHPSDYLDMLYLQRFRTEADRVRVQGIFCEVFDLPTDTNLSRKSLRSSTSHHHVQFGSALIARGDHCSSDNSVELQRNLQALEAASVCIQKGWLMIISGNSGAGKTQLIRYLASKVGRCLYELPISSGTDTADILGSFEQVSNQSEDISRFEWVDGPLVRAMKDGHWMVLDNANLCSPSVLDRINSLCETDGFLVLTERGLVNGEVETLRPHPHFRLMLTMDPHNGDLSRAMRNRAVEIHLLNTPLTTQDKIRLFDTMRTPSLSWSDDSPQALYGLQFDLIRRANFRGTGPSIVSWTATHSALLNNDFVASVMLDCATIHWIPYFGDLDTSGYTRTLLAVRMLAPYMIPIFRRLRTLLESHHLPGVEKILLSKTLFDELDHHPIWMLRQAVGESIAQIRGISLSFISAQPLDFLLTSKLLVEENYSVDGIASQQRILSTAISLYVYLHFHDHSEASSRSTTLSIFDMSRLYYNSQKQSQHRPGVLSLFPVYSSAMALARTVLKDVRLDHCAEQQLLLENTRELVDFAQQLYHSNSTPHFDFTSSMVISRWIREALVAHKTLLASPLCLHAESLSREVSLVTGHGMQDVWRNLLLPSVQESVHAALTRLDGLVISLNPNISFYDNLRFDAFNAMSLLGLGSLGKDENSIMKLCHDIEQRITSVDMFIKRGCSPQYPPQLAIAELEFLWRALSHKSSESITEWGDYLIRLASRTPRTSLARLTRAQHHLWTLDTHGTQAAGQSATLVAMVQEWMSAAQDICSIAGSRDTQCGPDVILKPVILYSTLGLCLHDQELCTLDSHENALRLHGALVVMQCHEGSIDRLKQILHVWTNFLLILAICFKETFLEDMWHKVIKAASDGQCHDLARMLAHSSNVHLSRIVRDRLIPASQALQLTCHAECQQICVLGKAWVEMGLAVLEIYLPDIPLDPVAAERCKFKLWKDREEEVLAQIKIHGSAEELITGRDINPLIDMLWSRLDQIRAKLQETENTLPARPVDVGRLHALFGEITPFITQFLHSNKFTSLIRDLETACEGSVPRALTAQATISGFMARLETGYPQFSDIIQPVLLALSFSKFGLHLLCHAARSSSTDAGLIGQLRILVQFPTVAAINAITTDVSTAAVSSQHILLTLIASAYTVCFGNFRPESLHHLDTTYHKIAELWMTDLHDQEREAQESQSLYRHKAQDGLITDDDIDEEISSMFPTYEDISVRETREADITFQTHNMSSTVPRLSCDNKERVYRLHLWIMDGSHSGSALQLLDDQYHELRTALLRNMLPSHIPQLSQSLDMESLQYQVLLISKGMGQLNGDRVLERKTYYNFYQDPNVPEVRKALSVIRNIQQRLSHLIKDWPDQMVLHHLMTRCEVVLQLNIRSPLAKVLSTLEQLLLQTEDWEIYSNRENTLKPQQVSISSLIIQWRRLELSCWSNLLESQYSSFCAGTMDWWIRLYDLTIRGTLGAAVSGSSLVEYFSEMIPLLERFVSSSPLGQFTARLELLKSFGVYSKLLSGIRCDSESEALARASRILHNLHGFFSQFSHSVAVFFAEKRAILEKELSDYIRLASWKDVNVHALKQSAQRTHRQLFKCVRKFRNLLREPVASTFLYKKDDPTVEGSILSSWSKPVFFCLDAPSRVIFPHVAPTDGIPHYMLHLSETFAKFENLLKSQGEPLINSVHYEPMNDLASQILETVAVLSSETDVAGGNIQMHKTLMMRKRKAWIDLLQELKRSGLPSRVKPEVLKRQQDKVWLLDRPFITPTESNPFHAIFFKAEGYFNRLVHSLPDLRHSLAAHHGDLTTRELQRAVTFVESSFGLAMDARARLVRDYLDQKSLSQTVQRFTALATTQGTIYGAGNVSSLLEFSYKVEHSLKEIRNGCLRYDKLANTPLSPKVFESLTTHLDVVQKTRQTLITLRENFDSIHKGLMMTEERNEFCVARTCLMSTITGLKNWMEEEPRIRHLCSPVLAWLLDDVPVSDDFSDDFSTSEPQNKKLPPKVLIDQLLLIVQGVISLRLSFPSLDPDQPPDNYVSQCEMLSGSVSQVFAIESVVKAVNAFIDDLIVSPLAGRLTSIRTILPFVNAYLRLVQNHLMIQVQLVKSSFKLSYVLCRVVLSLVQKGFCKPAELDESTGDAEQGDEVLDGTGLGHGTGGKNVSDQIQDESQVEGLRDEETMQPEPIGEPDGDAIEMGELGGDVEDLEGDDTETGTDKGGQPEVDEEVGKTDATNPDTVDEKLWGDEKVPGKNVDGQLSKEGAKEQNETSEVVAKEGEKDTSKQDDGDLSLTQTPEELPDEEMPDDQPIDAGRQMDNFVPEASTLDLPDDLELEAEDGGQDGDPDTQDDAMEEGEDETQQTFPMSRDPELVQDDFFETSQEECVSAHSEDNFEGDSQENPTSNTEDDQAQPTTTPPDFPEKSNQTKESGSLSLVDPPPSDGEMQDVEKLGTTVGNKGTQGNEANEGIVHNDLPKLPMTEEQKGTNNQDMGQTSSMAPLGSSSASPLLPNPSRSLGDTLGELRKRWDQIKGTTEFDPPQSPKYDDSVLPQEVEYSPEGMNGDNSLQTLGPAKENEAVKLRDLQISVDDSASDSVVPRDNSDRLTDTPKDQDVDSLSPALHMNVSEKATTRETFVESALMHNQIKTDHRDHSRSKVPSGVGSGLATMVNTTCPSPDEKFVEDSVKRWQESEHLESSAGEIWRLYDSLTQDLSFALCEQLRLILEPTLATRLQGDYRTGKRLNMKKIIPYIASEYTKDKIWLRRTRPSQREYQILIALDDSRSMAESRSVHLAYEALALVSKALNRLESGEVAIARFGEDVEIVHAFEDGLVGDREGEKIMQKFKFNQRKTDVLELVNASLQILMQARERRAVGRASREAADLWQLEIIISDGVCQDHDKLRTVLRRAEEQRVMMVFVIIDSLHTHNYPFLESHNIAQSSILAMNQASYKDVGGHLELQLDRYLDSFPFQYYVVLRSVEALPDVLSGTLKQFFERISEK